jgi:hypothetical protein
MRNNSDHGNGEGGSAGDLKNLSKGERKKIDAEAFKKDLVGRAGGKFNIAKDSQGNLHLVPVRKGSGSAQPTGITWDQALEWFPRR